MDDVLKSEEYLRCNPGVFLQKEWLYFIKEDKNAKILLIKIHYKNKSGFFVGLVFKKYGFTFIGSPFSGWSTPYFNIIGEIDVDKELYQKLLSYVRKKYHPLLVEIVHSNFTKEIVENYKHKELRTLILDISISEDELFKNFKQDARNFIRQFDRKGSRIEISNNDQSFASDYYSQLVDVFRKQNLMPTYNLSKVDNLMRNMINTQNLLCLKVYNPNNLCIATSIFVGDKDTFYFWGGASYREYQNYRPNEAMIWYAIKYWKGKGAKSFDMVGVRDYKRKFGSSEKTYYRIYYSSIPFIVSLRNLVEKIFYLRLSRRA